MKIGCFFRVAGNRSRLQRVFPAVFQGAFPVHNNKFRIGLCAVMLIVALRIAIGWHFFYEGIHKFDPAHDFSSKGFLGVAKGPTADLYFMMLPDLDGTKRLVVEPVLDQNGKPTNLRTFPVYEQAWAAYMNKYDARFGVALDEAGKKEVDRIYHQYVVSLREYAAENETAVRQYRESLARFNEEKKKVTYDVAHIQQRKMEGMMKYRGEAEAMIATLDQMGNDMVSALLRLYNPVLAGKTGQIVTGPEKALLPNPCVKSQIKLLDWTVTIGLTAIGFCMMVGFCNRLACLGCAAFLFNVWLVQFPFPGVYPPIPDMIGHFMLVSKDFVELVACLMLAALPAGRWGGLDYFLYHWFGGKKLARRFGLEAKDEACCCAAQTDSK